jgi:hypothetical protein
MGSVSRRAIGGSIHRIREFELEKVSSNQWTPARLRKCNKMGLETGSRCSNSHLRSCDLLLITENKRRQSYPWNRTQNPIGMWYVEVPTFSRQSAHRWRWGCQPYTSAALLLPWKFLVLISVRGWIDPRSIVRLEGLDQLKNTMTSLGFEPVTFRLIA